MKVIGLTGGIGTGKSTVSAYLSQKGCIILDADGISREMTQKGAPALEEIAKAFGDHLIDKEGNLNRQELGNIVFNDKSKLKKLEEIITEKVVEDINHTLFKLKEDNCDKIVVIDAPLLFECGMENMADENWLVYVDMPIRIKRIIERDKLTEDEIMSRINNQMSQEEKEKLSHYIIDNSGTLEDLHSQIDYHLERINNEH